MVVPASALVLIYGLAMVSASQGRPVAPLDDALIHFQYARQLTEGRPWQYISGDPPSTGATSLLYPFLLAAGIQVGLGGERLIWFVLTIGLVSLSTTALLVNRITSRLVSIAAGDDYKSIGWPGALAGLAFLTSGSIHWAFFNGMETGLFTLFILAGLRACLSGRIRHMGIASGQPL